ncbi:MAG: complex I NDUFA9 subunit family protein, partial [Geminicoccaceae bacterium]
MNNPLVTVFGGAGFIGRHLVRSLAAKGRRVKVISRTPGLCGHLQPLGDVGQIIVQSVDLADERALSELLKGSNAAINLIGILYETSKQRFDDVHGQFPGQMAKAAAEAGVRRVVHLSAIGADPQSSSAYARSKAEGERAVKEAFEPAVILRPSIVIGPEDDFFNRFAAMARLSPALPLIGGGKTRFQPIYVADVSAAIMKALELDSAKGEVFDLGGPKIYTFAELMRYMLAIIGRKRWLMNLSFGLAELQARFLELLPHPLLTRDQVELLKSDNVVDETAKTLADLQIT